MSGFGQFAFGYSAFGAEIPAVFQHAAPAVGSQFNRWWPTSQPGDDLPYLETLCQVQDAGDSVASATLSLAPSGSGEMQAINLMIYGYTLVVQLTGGVPGRVYRALLTINGLSGRIWQEIINIRVSSQTALAWPAPTAPVPGFGTPISWTSGAVIFGPVALVATGLVGVGNSQSTALPLLAVTNIIASAPPGTGFVLPSTIVSGTIVVQDDDQTNNAAIYPPVGAQINALGVNVPFFVGSTDGRINFSTNSPATQWYAA
jgi:hypothetical protein